jgi:hypothetical protein
MLHQYCLVQPGGAPGQTLAAQFKEQGHTNLFACLVPNGHRRWINTQRMVRGAGIQRKPASIRAPAR